MDVQAHTRVCPRSGVFWFLLVAQSLAVAFGIAFTRKSSRDRHLVIVLLVILMYMETRLLPCLTGPPILRGTFTFFCLLKAWHFISILAIVGIELHDLTDPTKKLHRSKPIRRLLAAATVLFSFRGIGTSWMIQSVRPVPARDRLSSGVVLTGSLVHRVATIMWQVVVLDLIFLGYIDDLRRSKPHLFAAGTEFLGPQSTAEQLRARTILCIVGIIGLGMLMDLTHKLLAIICVGMRISSWDDWPPAFGDIKHAYTVRQFWSKFWHQFFRWPTTTISTFARHHLRRFIRLPAALDQLLGLTLIFGLSGFTHWMAAVYAEVPGDLTGIFAFFLVSSLVIPLEDVCWRAYARLIGQYPRWRLPRRGEASGG
ncbi:wax synthase family protein [Aspergillus saccharolyticus JOP 1030-1]|uniref:Wax synthase domain-containing protein n=1 Tax=Aspergillus saccharolyticus JOP 1030-1 TaxID=1450539 RepID=A0A318Z8M6_9EURO|nr:hypothetical protein BP01DRAFT_424749 [Aspergillus saccharolyticus JOP 1030-1]PYH43691.1 hypothetical protein BP01DRAFT_424749 [Aspergillus saccharolyticus JOP 1030-1]